MSNFVFVDFRVADYEMLLDGLNDDTKVVVLDSSTDGVVILYAGTRIAD